MRITKLTSTNMEWIRHCEKNVIPTTRTYNSRRLKKNQIRMKVTGIIAQHEA